MKICLLFPPGWTLNVGSPHLAIGQLQGYLLSLGQEVIVRDLNREVGEYYGAKVTLPEVEEACKTMTMESMNRLYFNAEDRLNQIAHQYGGQWNAQLGYEFKGLSHASSKDVLEACKTPSPYVGYYKGVVVPWLNKEQPQIVGLSLATEYQLMPAFQLVSILREEGFSGTIVMGGNTITRLANEIIRAEWPLDMVDVFIRNQGEVPFASLIHALESNKELDRVPNAIWKCGSNPQINEPDVRQDLNELPTPNFDFLNVGEYWGQNYLPLVAARGCYYGKCSFCSIPYAWGFDGYAGRRANHLVHQDMLNLAERYNVNRFKFVDESATPSMLRELANLIKQRGDEFGWEAYTRLEKIWLDGSFVSTLAHGGLKKAYFGLEILEHAGRSGLLKNDHSAQVEQMLVNCHKAGIKVHVFCMFGFPGTSESDARRTVDFVLSHSDIIDTADLNAYSYSKHTNVPGISVLESAEHDWALDYDFESKDGLTSTAKAASLAADLEELAWSECPRLLHPIYRLWSPWQPSRILSSAA